MSKVTLACGQTVFQLRVGHEACLAFMSLSVRFVGESAHVCEVRVEIWRVSQTFQWRLGPDLRGLRTFEKNLLVVPVEMFRMCRYELQHWGVGSTFLLYVLVCMLVSVVLAPMLISWFDRREEWSVFVVGSLQ